ncbi:DNA polymerase III subunit delta' [Tumebacillus permanentifrigoris]|uniref:DNA polymerase III subunit delta' n=1 Tax=Tumebacillus permanentifrigoris TaxID=378543 RepID=A0A316D559_9BACL|nr:DNA polymerase III subunit delta' [Tumebacillus permanentifrigoris]PWK07953.1 DNA polymerase III delta prime subunit [Tumebacillus permanentifrigoris]
MTWPVPGPASDMLARSLHTGRLAHAYLFLGSEGSGQVETAQYFAKSILCTSAGERPCGVCSQCRRVESHNHPDLITLEPDGNAIKIAQVRELQKAFSRKAMENASKVYIIHHADKMTVEAANALLKFLEEPTTPVVAILLADSKAKLLPTVISRCMLIAFERRPIRQVEDLLVADGVSSTRAKFLAYLKQSYGAAKEFASQERFAEILSLMVQLSEELATRRGNPLFTIQEKVIKPSWQGAEVDALLDCLAWWYRDVLHVSLGLDTAVAADSQLDKYRSQAAQYRTDQLVEMIEIILTTKKRLQGNANVQLTLEQMILRLQGV